MDTQEFVVVPRYLQYGDELIGGEYKIMIRILATPIFLMCLVGCDKGYTIRIDGEEYKTINTDCRMIVISCDSMGHIIYQYYISVIPKGRALARLNNLKVYINKQERRYSLWRGSKPIKYLDSLYIDFETSLRAKCIHRCAFGPVPSFRFFPRL